MMSVETKSTKLIYAKMNFMKWMSTNTLRKSRNKDYMVDKPYESSVNTWTIINEEEINSLIDNKRKRLRGTDTF